MNTLFLLTLTAADGTKTERIIEADSRKQAIAHALEAERASPADVARVLGAGGKVEKVEA